MKIVERYGCKFEVPDEELTHCPIKLLGYLTETLKRRQATDAPDLSHVQFTLEFVLELQKQSEMYRRNALDLFIEKHGLTDNPNEPEVLDKESQAWAMMLFGPRKPENEDET
jgi:hypothetical protein